MKKGVIDYITAFRSRWSPALETEPVHIVLLGIGAIIGCLAVAWYAKHLHLEVGEIPEFLPHIYRRNLFRPEPHEPFLYHVGLIAVPAIALLVWIIGLNAFDRLRRQEKLKKYITAKNIGKILLILLPVCLLFMYKVLPFLLSPTRAQKAVLIFKQNELNFITILSIIGACTFLCYRLKKKDSLPEYRAETRWWEILIVLLILIFLLWNPSYKYFFGLYEGTVHHFHFFLGPVNDVLHGKFLMVNTESQYGILLTLFLTVIFKYLLPLSYANLYLVVMMVTIVYYFFLYIFLKKIHHSRIFASLALLSIFAAHILALNTYNPPHETYAYPSVTPLRFIFDIPIFLLLLHYVTTQKNKFLYLASISAGVAVLYNFEIGISLVLSLIAFTIFSFFFSSESLRVRGMRAMWSCMIMAATVLIVGGIISLIGHTITGEWPDWMRLLYHTRIHGTGFMAMPLPKGPHLYYGALAIYAAVLLAMAVQGFFKALSPRAPLFGTLAVYGLLIFHYYLNRSHTNNLFVVIVPAMILISIILKLIWTRARQTWQGANSNPSFILYTTITAGLAGIYILLGAYQIPTFAKVMTQRYSPLFVPKGSFVWGYRGTGFYEPYVDPKPFEEAAHALSIHADKDGRVALLSGYDTLLCIMSSTVNVIDYFNVENEPNVRQQLENATAQLTIAKPNTLFIDTNRTVTNNIEDIFNAVKDDYTFAGQRGMLSMFTRNQ